VIARDRVIAVIGRAATIIAPFYAQLTWRKSANKVLGCFG
jgi:hypothetical protein